MEFDLEDPLAGDVEESTSEKFWLQSIESLFAAESDHLSSFKNPEHSLPIRRDAVSLISQAQDSMSLDPFVVYLATNYVDRFLSRETISRDKPWIVALLAVACLSLACKMHKMEFTVGDVLEAEGLAFDSQTVRRMELFVLRALDWRMRSITPFSFLRFFLSLFHPTDQSLLASLKCRASEIILDAQNETKLLNCKPSAAAASALLTASHSLSPLHFPSFFRAITSCPYVHKEDLWSDRLDCSSSETEAKTLQSTPKCGSKSQSIHAPTFEIIFAHIRYSLERESEVEREVAEQSWSQTPAKLASGKEETDIPSSDQIGNALKAINVAFRSSVCLYRRIINEGKAAATDNLVLSPDLLSRYIRDPPLTSF